MTRLLEWVSGNTRMLARGRARIAHAFTHAPLCAFHKYAADETGYQPVAASTRGPTDSAKQSFTMPGAE